jgi:hypothetical protein
LSMSTRRAGAHSRFLRLQLQASTAKATQPDFTSATTNRRLMIPTLLLFFFLLSETMFYFLRSFSYTVISYSHAKMR